MSGAISRNCNELAQTISNLLVPESKHPFIAWPGRVSGDRCQTDWRKPSLHLNMYGDGSSFPRHGMSLSGSTGWHQPSILMTMYREWTEAWVSHKLQIPGLSYNWWGFQAWDTLQDSTDNSSIDKVETSLDCQEYFSQLQDTTDALSCHIHLPVCLWIVDPHSRAPKKNASHGNEVLPQDTTYLIQRPCYQRGSPCQDPAGNRTSRRSLDDRKETQTAVVWSCFSFIRSGQNHLAKHSERGKKTRWTKEEVENNIREWTGLEFGRSQRAVENGDQWRKLAAKSSVVPKRPSRLRDWWWWWWHITVTVSSVVLNLL